MPRPGPRRPNVGLKLDPPAIAAIDRRALDEGLTIRGGEPNRSEALRLLIAYGLTHMPPGWRPEQETTTMDRLKNMFRTSTTTTGYEYGVAGSPAVPYRDNDDRNRMIEPESLTVTFTDGRLDHVIVEGTLAHNPNLRASRRFDKARDVPYWARDYLVAPNDDE